MLREMKESGISVEKASAMSAEELEGKTINGVLFATEAPEFSEEYHKSVVKA